MRWWLLCAFVPLACVRTEGVFGQVNFYGDVVLDSSGTFGGLAVGGRWLVETDAPDDTVLVSEDTSILRQSAVCDDVCGASFEAVGAGRTRLLVLAEDAASDAITHPSLVESLDATLDFIWVETSQPTGAVLECDHNLLGERVICAGGNAAAYVPEPEPRAGSISLLARAAGNPGILRTGRVPVLCELDDGPESWVSFDPATGDALAASCSLGEIPLGLVSVTPLEVTPELTLSDAGIGGETRLVYAELSDEVVFAPLAWSVVTPGAVDFDVAFGDCYAWSACFFTLTGDEPGTVAVEILGTGVSATLELAP